MVRESGDRLVTRARRWVFERNPIEWITAGFLVVLLASGLFGGLREVDTDPMGSVAIGTPVATDPVTVTVEKVYWDTTFGGIPRDEAADPPVPAVSADEPAGGRFVVVEATVRNTTDTTVDYDVLRAAVSLSGGTGFLDTGGDLVAAADAAPTWVYTVPEKRIFARAQPGIDYRVAYVWDQSATVPLPARLGVDVNGHTWREDTLDFHWAWKDPEARASGTFPLARRSAS